jgi:hypothetical protein
LFPGFLMSVIFESVEPIWYEGRCVGGRPLPAVLSYNVPHRMTSYGMDVFSKDFKHDSELRYSILHAWTPCCLVDGWQRFGGIYCLHYQDNADGGVLYNTRMRYSVLYRQVYIISQQPSNLAIMGRPDLTGAASDSPF